LVYIGALEQDIGILNYFNDSLSAGILFVSQVSVVLLLLTG